MRSGVPEIVISGIGMLSSYGVGATTFGIGLLSGKVGGFKREVTPLPLRSSLSERIVSFEDGAIDDLRPVAGVRGVGFEAKMAMAVSHLALIDAGIDVERVSSERIGIAMSAHYSGLQDYAEQFSAGVCEPEGAVSPTRGPRTGFNATAGYLGIGLRAEGPNVTFVNGAVGGFDALIYAIDALTLGRADVMIVCGVDRVPGVMTEVLAARRGTPPARPFDRMRDGPIFGDGAAALLLEREGEFEHGDRHRQVTISGVATASATELSTACRLALEDALRSSGYAPGDVRACLAAGNGSRGGDEAEAAAISGVLDGQRPVCAIRGGIGDLPAAGVLAQAAAGVLCLESKRLPPTPGFLSPDPQVSVGVSRTVRVLQGGPVIVDAWDEDGLAGALVLSG